ncbi:hypothetical protein OFR39_14360 [Brachyspira hyodysenteriae]|uniref:hypothetical protein n=1 Tax=Brachyspira hyodysenteriae TaxID=159 RepID=UPI0022CE33E1|nr:hypothetical protein [Brachyspira hyodysenteriae]MDA0027793.1 hypothetical protein [Brachyspira hyodysenteriae]
MKEVNGYWSCFMIHSKNNGILKEVKISDKLRENNIIEYNILSKINDKILSFDNSGGTIGTAILNFSSMDEMLEKMDNMDKYIKVITE